MYNHDICAEIMYETDHGPVHSDVCPGEYFSAEYRRLIHNVLDEWMNDSQRTGFFYIGNPDSLRDNFSSE